MGIKILSKDVINKISAGEVVEKPASIVKELVENSIDAGASSITIEIENGGIDKICVTDNGCGIKKDEVVLAFTPHATSKLKDFEDLNQLSTMGFRGEALATISAVSKVTIITKTADEDVGIKCEIISGEEINRIDVASTTGTKIEVKDVFYNTPARLKFLRKPKSEEGDITNYVQKLILSNPNICFKYVVNNKPIYNTTSSSLIDSIYTIYGKEVAENIIEVDYNIGSYKIYGYISKPEFAKSNRTYQNLFVNSRFCINSLVSSAVLNAYENFTMKGKFPLFCLYINLPQDELDVNVHPNKLEVKFTNNSKIYKLCLDGVFKALSDFNHIRSIDDGGSDYINNSSNVKFVRDEILDGISFGENLKTNVEHDFSAENIDAKNSRDNILGGQMSKYFNENSNNTGSIGFELTNNLISSFEIGQNQKADSFLEEIVLSESAVKEANNFEIKQSNFDKIFDFSYRIVGTIFNTYLIIEQENKMYLIDQHAAHERIKYDSLMEQLNSNNLDKQVLMFPYVFNVSSNEYNFLIENLNLINEFGIEIYEFGSNTFKISSVPMLISGINLKEFIENMLNNINGFAKSPKDILKEKFMQIACKSAVKGGDNLKDIEIKHLLSEIKDKTKVLLCPHGRPIVVEIDIKQIEKWFKRIL